MGAMKVGSGRAERKRRKRRADRGGRIAEGGGRIPEDGSRRTDRPGGAPAALRMLRYIVTHIHSVGSLRH